jgi:hypothetical protein
MNNPAYSFSGLQNAAPHRKFYYLLIPGAVKRASRFGKIAKKNAGIPFLKIKYGIEQPGFGLPLWRDDHRGFRAADSLIPTAFQMAGLIKRESYSCLNLCSDFIAVDIFQGMNTNDLVWFKDILFEYDQDTVLP